MAADADASAAARALALKRWDPETRLRSAVGLVIEHVADLDAAQRAAIGAAITTGGEDTDE